MLFKVEPLLINAPLNRSTNVIFKRTHNNKPINTEIKKNTMPKRMKDLETFRI